MITPRSALHFCWGARGRRAPPGHGSPEPCRPLVRLLLATAARKGEIAGLRWGKSGETPSTCVGPRAGSRDGFR
jgi:hypothetical protein